MPLPCPSPPLPPLGTAAVLCALGLFACGVSLAAGDSRKAGSVARIAEREADLQGTRQRIQQLQQAVQAGEASRAETGDQLRSVEQAISGLQRELHELADQRRDRLAARDALQRQAAALEADLDGHRHRLEQTVVRLYQRGLPDTARLLLAGRDPSQMARDLVYLAAIADARQGVVRATSDSLAEKRELAEKTRREAEALADVEARQREQQARLQQQKAERQKLLASLAGRLAAQRQEIGALRRDEQRLARVVERLSRLLAEEARARKKKPPAESAASGSRAPARPAPAEAAALLAGPGGGLLQPVAGRLEQRFGAPQEGGGRWKGLFYSAAAGSEVRAAAAGEIVFADWLRGFGNLLIVDHGAGYLTIYGYNEALLRRVGERVRQGTPVATVGNSGGRAETGLYFELRHQGAAIDPGRWLRNR